MIKKRTKAFADIVMSNPDTTPTQAYIDTHITENRLAARVNASQLLAKPDVMAYMATKSDAAEKTIAQVMQNAKKRKDNVQWQRLAHDSANTILDRVHGKPITRSNNTNLDVNLEDLLSNLT